MLNDRCYTGSDNLLMLNDESYSGGRIANLIEKNITANGTYSASEDEADGYSQVNVEVPGVLIVTDLIPTPATADSTEPFANTQWDSNAAAWHAFDKDISTCWASGNGMAGNWQIGYAFPEPVVVNRVKIINRDDPTWGVSQAPQVFWIYGSNDGENWTEVTSGGHIWTGLNEEFVYDFDNAVAYSSWKIHTKLSMAGATGNLSLSIIGFYNRTYLPASHNASSLEDLHSLSNTSRVVIPGNYYLAISKTENFTLDGILLEQGSKSDSIYFFYDSDTYCIIGRATTDLLSHSGIEDASIGLVALTGPVNNYEWSTVTASISADVDDIFLYISAYGTGNGNWVSSGADVIDVNDFIYSRTSGRSAWLLKATSTTITMRNAGIFLKLRNMSDE